MKQAKILLLDVSAAGNLSSTLRGILESSASLRVQLRHEFIEVCGPAVYRSDLSRTISEFNPDVIFLVLSPSLLNQARALLSFVRRESCEAPMIVVMEAGGADLPQSAGQAGDIFELLSLGVDDFVTAPLKAIDIVPRVWRLLGQTRQGKTPTQRLKQELGLKQLVGESPAFLAEVRKIPLVAKCDASILISGETGTGKELCARAIHYLSPRARKPFIPVNCGAIPTDLVENELFGHEQGAFTGACASQVGLIHEADGGTLFLDEIDCLPLLAQVKLLRFLQDKQYRPLGSTKMRQVDVRVIAATNIDLEEAVRQGKVRQDLYYRLSVIPLVLPPLRARREDIPLLARYFLGQYAAEFDKHVTDLSSEATRKLVLYDWPGNVRELEHVVERVVVLSEQAVIQSADIIVPGLEAAPRQESFQEAKSRVVAQFEKTYIQDLLLAYHGNITQAAQAAQKNRRAFWQLMRKHRIDARSLK